MKQPTGITPLPWKYIPLKRRGSDHCDSHQIVSTDEQHDQYWIAATQTVGRDGEVVVDGNANAAYIVQACNQYPKLVEALRLMRDAWNSEDETKRGRERRAKAWKAVSDALAACGEVTR